jgi:hypothetical protein
MTERAQPGELAVSRTASPRWLHVTIWEMLALVAALGISFRWPGMGVPLGLVCVGLFARRRDLFGRKTHFAAVLVAVALYLPPAVVTVLDPFQDWNENLTVFSFRANFILGALVSQVLPWFDPYTAPLFAIEERIASAIIDILMIAGLGALAARGWLWRIAIVALVLMISAASTCLCWFAAHLPT